MISKEEFIRLYCDEIIYKKTGVIGIADYKVNKQLDINEHKTLQDLSDYGYPAEIERIGRNKIVTWDVDNFGNSSGSKSVGDSIIQELEKLQRALGGGSRHTKLPDIDMDFDPDEFDWGSEDSIK